MKTFKIVLTLILFSTFIHAQHCEGNFEFGPTVVTVNSIVGYNYFEQNRPRVEYLNGIFFRYTDERAGLRAFSAYSQYQASSAGTSTFASLCDGWGGSLNYKDFKIGAGGQYSVFKNSEWLYTFIDIAYNNVYWAGPVFGDTPSDQYSYSATINGFDTYLGFGLKLKAFKVLSVSPELSYNVFRGWEKNNRTSLITGQTANNKYNLASSRPVLKIQLAYRF